MGLTGHSDPEEWHVGAPRESELPDPDSRLVELALDLHDGPLQDLAAAMTLVGPLREQVRAVAANEGDETLAIELLGEVENAMFALERHLRNVVWATRSGDLLARSFRACLDSEVRALESAGGIEASIQTEGDFEALPSSVRVALIRVIHEVFTNVLAHSAATAVTVVMRSRDGRVEVEVIDNGSGFDIDDVLPRAAKTGRLGIIGIRERVRLLGGRLDIDSRPGGPTKVSLKIQRAPVGATRQPSAESVTADPDGETTWQR